MARCLVTGAAGFIGSHLTERLLRDGHEVVGVDCLTPQYPADLKRRNLTASLRFPAFAFWEEDLTAPTVLSRLGEFDIVFHLAAQTGVRESWGGDFDHYLERNLRATQRLLDAASEAGLQKLVYASSSSVYGDAERLPTSEDVVPRPVSPYGITKLAAEQLCDVYRRSRGVPVVVLRYFTVYGPRQRPDMAFDRFIRALLEGRPIQIYGDGQQSRDFTYVGDIVEGTVRAAFQAPAGETYNLGGGSRTSLREVLAVLAEITGIEPRIVHLPAASGDARHTGADFRKAVEQLGYCPQTDLATGLRQQVAWVSGSLSEPVGRLAS